MDENDNHFTCCTMYIDMKEKKREKKVIIFTHDKKEKETSMINACQFSNSL